MIKRPDTNAQRLKRHKRVRAKLSGTPERPRLNVFRSEKNIYAQVIDDVAGNTLVSASSLDKEIEGNGGNKTAARAVGKLVAERCKAKGIDTVVFDRGGYLYHGRVQALAEGAELCDKMREGMNHLLRTQDFTELEAALRAADGHLELSAPEEAFGELRRAQVQVETLEWLSSDIFGKVVQIKKGVTIDRDKTSINLNENMDSLVPASKISDMPTGWICGQTARDFIQTKTGIGGSMNVQESEEFKTSKFFCKTDFDMKEIKKEEAAYVPLPKFYTFKSREERERILYRNFVNVGIEVKEMIKDVLNKRGAK